MSAKRTKIRNKLRREIKSLDFQNTKQITQEHQDRLNIETT